MSNLTEEQAAEMRSALADYDAAQAAAARAQNREVLLPLINAGLGSDGEVVGLTQAMREAAEASAAVDPVMPNLLLAAAGVMETLNDRVRSLWVTNSEPEPEVELEAEA